MRYLISFLLGWQCFTRGWHYFGLVWESQTGEWRSTCLWCRRELNPLMDNPVRPGPKF